MKGCLGARRRRGLAGVVAALWIAGAAAGAAAQDFTGLARVDPGQSGLSGLRRGVALDLALSQTVPWRVFALDAPRRLVLDFREVDWSGLDEAALGDVDGVADLRFGALRPGWSRMVLDLAAPLAVETAEMAVDAEDGAARLRVVLRRVTAEAFSAAAGAPPDPDWELVLADPTAPAARPQEGGPLVVVLDPGHGGIDPGAQRGGVDEADLMLRLALELQEALRRAGMEPVLTRRADVFVPLQERMTIARAAGADLLISLHADALAEDQAEGASVYTLTDAAEDRASQRLAERHDRGDLLAGLDLSGQDDRVATVLMDLARLETAPSGERLAAALVAGLGEAGAALNTRPRREAVLAVLRAADFPSVLLEVGFLSSASDRARLLSEAGRGRIVDGIVRGLQAWAAEEAALAPLRRR